MPDNILIPTDFSAVANYAATAGIAPVKIFKARVHLLNCLEVPEDLRNRQPDTKIQIHRSGQYFLKLKSPFVYFQTLALPCKVKCIFQKKLALIWLSFPTRYTTILGIKKPLIQGAIFKSFFVHTRCRFLKCA